MSVIFQRNISYKVCYYTDSDKYASGYYSATGTQYSETAGTLVDVRTADQSNKDIVLLNGGKITGTVMLAGSKKASSDGANIEITAFSVDSKEAICSTIATISEGQNSNTFSLSKLPIISTINGYKIGVTTNGNPDSFYYIGYSGLTKDWASAKVFDVKTVDVIGVNITVEDTKNPDVNGDGNVDISDLNNASKQYNVKNDSTEWNGNYDINGDGVIDILDLVDISKHIK